MNTQEFINFVPIFMDKLTKDGMSQSIIDNNKWIIDSFIKYCSAHKISEIDMAVIQKFYEQQYNMDIYNLNSPLQTTIRRPLLIFMEYYNYGTYYKTHQKSKRLSIPPNYNEIFTKYQVDFVNNLDNCKKNKDRKLWCMQNLIIFFNSKNIKSIENVEIKHLSEYVLFLQNQKKYAPETIRLQKGILREAFDWFYECGFIKFSGKDAFPIIKRYSNAKMLSTYTKDEIQKLLNSIDTETKTGKFTYSVLTILAYLGIRAGDLINLKFENIDWETNKLSFMQQKTNKNITLPLIDEVKYPLLDYIKNARNNSDDRDYIFITLYAPYTKLRCTTNIYRIVSEALEKAGIVTNNKHHGPHALRHSLATNMLNENVPISAISQILGHSDIKTTEIYTTKNTKHLRHFTLEVPNEKR